jgi:hypothetical protein
MGIVAAMVNVPQDNHDEQHCQQRREPAHFADLLPRHLAERFAVAPHGGEQDDKVLHRTADHRADDYPESAGQVTELSGEHGSDQGSRSGDRGKVVAEQNPLVCRLEVVSVAEALGRRGALVVERHYARSDELRVEAEAEQVGARGGRDQPDTVDRFAAAERDARQTKRRQNRHGNPEQVSEDSFHRNRDFTASRAVASISLPREPVRCRGPRDLHALQRVARSAAGIPARRRAASTSASVSREASYSTVSLSREGAGRMRAIP